MSRIRIEGETTVSKDIIARGVVNAVKGRLMAIKEEIQAIDKDIELLRKKHGIDDEDFMLKFTNGDLGDDEDFFVWESSLKLRKSLVDEQAALREAL